MQLDVIATADRYDAKEHQHEQIAQSLIREKSGIEEGEDHTEDTHENHLQTSIIGQWQSDDTGQTRREGNGFLHRIEFHPPLGTGSSGPQSCLHIIRSISKIKEVIDEVGIDLHGKGEEQTEQRCRPTEHLVFILEGIDPCQGHTYHHRHSSTR